MCACGLSVDQAAIDEYPRMSIVRVAQVFPGDFSDAVEESFRVEPGQCVAVFNARFADGAPARLGHGLIATRVQLLQKCRFASAGATGDDHQLAHGVR